ncbi:hypothetical protein BCAR13_200023 [Paraburkholderia caribensis]|nr:hypothetical protein BCAR13_200023 [Paraburkholderia caribensis]
MRSNDTIRQRGTGRLDGASCARPSARRRRDNLLERYTLHDDPTHIHWRGHVALPSAVGTAR